MNATNIKFIYFDLDDTLLNHEQAERAALLNIYETFPIFQTINARHLVEVYHRINAEQWILYSDGRIDSSQLRQNRFKLTLRHLGLNENQSREIGAQYMQFYEEHWQWIDGAGAAFKAIGARYDVGILTNGFTETQKKKFSRFNLYNLAEHLVISEETGTLKPHPAIFEHATKLAGHKPEEIFYVGDSYRSDIIGGHNFGWQVAWFTSNHREPQKNKADFVFSDFKNLCEILHV